MKLRMAVTNKAPEIDLEKRILRQVCFLSDMLASDGGIVLIPGVDLAERFLPNPIVQRQHCPDVIGRAIEVTPGSHEIIATVQFADTDMGREMAYLYGVNKDREVFMRAWSAGFRVLQSDLLSAESARSRYPAQWDAKQFEALPRYMQDQIEIVTRCEVSEFSAVARGADKASLTRARDAGCKIASDMIHAASMAEMRELLDNFRREQDGFRGELQTLSAKMQAVETKGASAGPNGDSDELRAEIGKLTEMARR